MIRYAVAARGSGYLCHQPCITTTRVNARRALEVWNRKPWSELRREFAIIKVRVTLLEKIPSE